MTCTRATGTQTSHSSRIRLRITRRSSTQGPIYREPNHGAFVVTGYDETAAIYRDTESFSSCNSFSGPFPPLPGAPYDDDVSDLIEKHRDLYTGHDSLVTEDPPLHTDHRGLLLRLLTPKRLQENEEFMWRMAEQCIDTFIDRGRCDFIAEYARPFSMLVIADLLGVPEEDHPKLRALFDQAGAPGAVGKELPSNPIWFLDDFFLAYVENRRREPRDDVLTKLALNAYADGRIPEPMEAVNVATILFAGGQGTVRGSSATRSDTSPSSPRPSSYCATRASASRTSSRRCCASTAR